MAEVTPAEASPTLPHHTVRLTLTAVALGLLIDLLFRRQSLGISYPIWSALSAGALLLAASWEGRRPHPTGGALAAGIVALSFTAAIRLEPLTVALGVLGTLALFALWLRVLWSGRLGRYGWLDLLLTAFWAPVETLIRPWSTLSDSLRKVAGDRATRSRAAAVLRGALLAGPVLLIFLVLLASADLIFRDLVEQALAWLDLVWIREFIAHSFFIGVGTMISLGALVAGVRRRDLRPLIGEDRSLIPRFLGWTEATVVLASVDIVFAIFVLIQFRYLFGGEANITQAGYTYAEYARRGFGEMVWAAIFGQGLVLALAQITRTEGRRQPAWTRALSAGLLALLLATLLSALTRLLLYEQAFGFTRSRTYAHIFIYWLGALLVSLLVLLYLQRTRLYALLNVTAAVGFALSLSVVNVDGFIATRNLDRWELTGDLDTHYLSLLSYDAVQALAERATAESPSELLALLACRSAMLESDLQQASWQSYHFGRRRAQQALETITDLLGPFTVTSESMRLAVEGPGLDQQPCLGRWLD